MMLQDKWEFCTNTCFMFSVPLGSLGKRYGAQVGDGEEKESTDKPHQIFSKANEQV